MQKNLLYLLGFLLLIVTSCKEEDFNKPEITLLGEEQILTVLNTAYLDPGATATDKEDGDITSSISISNPVDFNYAADYIVRYNVSDNAGNSATEVTRSVTVENAAREIFQGSYGVVITTVGQPPYNYTEQINPNRTLNWRVDFAKFGDYPNATADIFADISGGTITIPTQTITSGSTPIERTFEGSGTISLDPLTNMPSITLLVTETINGVAVDYTYDFNQL